MLEGGIALRVDLVGVQQAGGEGLGDEGGGLPELRNIQLAKANS